MNTHPPTPSLVLTRSMIATAAILLVPLVAMQLTDNVAWGPLDFVVAGLLLFATSLALQFAVSKAGSIYARMAWGLGILSCLVMIWAMLAVGLVAAAGDPGDLLYVAVLLIAVGGAFGVRFRAEKMAVVMAAAAVAHGLATAVVLLVLRDPLTPPAAMFLPANLIFISMFTGSALLFKKDAAGKQRV